jgi:hypothetical protein
MRSAKRIAALVSGGAAWALSSAALAQALPDFAGIVQVHGAAERSSADGHADDRWVEREEITEVGGFAAVAFTLGGRFLVQGDVWAAELSGEHTDKWDGDFDTYSSDSSLKTSVAGHVAMRLNDDAVLGVMVSKSDVREDSRLYTAALEGAVTGDKWRVSTQAGVTWLDAKPSWIVDQDVVYAWARYAYYPHPNLSVAADVRASGATLTVATSIVDVEEIGLGARVEYKPEALPVTGFVSYQTRGRWESDNYWGPYKDGVSHRITLGVRLAFGAGESTLQATDRRIGFHDANPLYGLPEGSR